MTTVDFGKALRDAKTASYEALPIGDYDVEVAVSDSIRASTGKPMIKVQLKVLTGPYQGRQVFNNFVFSAESPQAMAMFFRHMRAFGLTEEFFASLGSNGSMDAVATALLNRRAKITLGQREWQGETRNEVKGVKPYTGAPGAPVAGPVGPQPTPPPMMAPPVAPPASPQPAPMPAPVAAQPAAPAQPASPPQPSPVAQPQYVEPQQPIAPPQPAYEVPAYVPPPPATADAGPTPPAVAGPVIEAAPFDGTTGPLAVPTDAAPSVGAAESSSPAPTQPTYEPPIPPGAPELPI